MAEFLLKNLINEAFVARLSAALKGAYPEFDSAAFAREVFDARWAGLELKQRFRRISQCMREALPQSLDLALQIVTRAGERVLEEEGTDAGMRLEWMVLPDFVEAYATERPDAALPALESLTRLASAEFAVRPFLARYPERMYRQMQRWALHEHPLVRRLASEGFRPRLPWGLGVPALKKDPSPILQVLERLKTDPAETVRRSVANNLNDIAKDHPELAIAIASDWLRTSPEAMWVIKHGCRGLLKRGNPQALALFGYAQGAEGVAARVEVAGNSVVIGEALAFVCEVSNAGDREQALRIEYAIAYLTSTGARSRKVFHLRQLSLAPGGATRLERRQRFVDLTTRKHYPGPHSLELLVNGQVMAKADFDLIR